MKKTGKNYKIISKEVDFWPDLKIKNITFFGCRGNVKNDGHENDISKE